MRVGLGQPLRAFSGEHGPALRRYPCVNVAEQRAAAHLFLERVARRTPAFLSPSVGWRKTGAAHRTPSVGWVSAWVVYWTNCNVEEFIRPRRRKPSERVAWREDAAGPSRHTERLNGTLGRPRSPGRLGFFFCPLYRADRRTKAPSERAGT